MKEANDPKPVKSGKKPWVDITDIKTLIELIKNTEVSELEVEKDGVRVKLKKSQGSTSSPAILAIAARAVSMEWSWLL